MNCSALIQQLRTVACSLKWLYWYIVELMVRYNLCTAFNQTTDGTLFSGKLWLFLACYIGPLCTQTTGNQTLLQSCAEFSQVKRFWGTQDFGLGRSHIYTEHLRDYLHIILSTRPTHRQEHTRDYYEIVFKTSLWLFFFVGQFWTVLGWWFYSEPSHFLVTGRVTPGNYDIATRSEWGPSRNKTILSGRV